MNAGRSRSTCEFLSTLPARGATDHVVGQVVRRGVISIHAPREGSDAGAHGYKARSQTFLSTLPARGATLYSASCSFRTRDFYPRSPRGERRLLQGLLLGFCIISIHAPREGSDDTRLTAVQRISGISIHAPREGSDSDFLSE